MVRRTLVEGATEFTSTRPPRRRFLIGALPKQENSEVLENTTLNKFIIGIKCGKSLLRALADSTQVQSRTTSVASQKTVLAVCHLSVRMSTSFLGALRYAWPTPANES